MRALQAVEAQLQTAVHHVHSLLTLWCEALATEPWALETPAQEMQGTEMLRFEGELAELDALAVAVLCHPSAALRKEALVLAAATRELHRAQKAAYERTVVERLLVAEHKLLGTRKSTAPADASGLTQEIEDMRRRQERIRWLMSSDRTMDEILAARGEKKDAAHGPTEAP